MSATAKILADSINPAGRRLTSFLLTYPRFIHSELMTHRAFSRNAASSRAIPFPKMLQAVESNPAGPSYWGAEQKGMQSGETLSDYAKAECAEMWGIGSHRALHIAKQLHLAGVHKSICNRLLEPFSWMTVLVTASDWGFANFFALRAHPAAQPEFQELAFKMLDIYSKSQPEEIAWGGWHIPRFGDKSSPDYGLAGDISNALKIATARCARLSYLTFDGDHSPERDIELHDRLIGPPFHASPFEHCAQAVHNPSEISSSNFDVNGVLCGWLQYRKQFASENITTINPAELLAKKPDWIKL